MTKTYNGVIVCAYGFIPVKTRRPDNVASMLGRSLQHWFYIATTLPQRLVCCGATYIQMIDVVYLFISQDATTALFLVIYQSKHNTLA